MLPEGPGQDLCGLWIMGDIEDVFEAAGRDDLEPPRQTGGGQAFAQCRFRHGPPIEAQDLERPQYPRRVLILIVAPETRCRRSR